MAETDHLALYRLWRPQTFSDMVAQEQVVFPLRQSVITGKFAHALLFSGTRGTGKTSLAKIFAKAINCLDPREGDPCNRCEICLAANNGSLMDINEIDAASHNSVDHIRRLTDEIIFTPVRAKYKVYIIDEVHMLSQGAFNALLKTLEEPPGHAVFIMATTEPHRIPATIISRSQHFQFRRIGDEEIMGRMRVIADHVDLSIQDEALEVIAQLSGGALRDAISLLDQTRQLGKEDVSRDDVLTLAGRVPDQFLSETAEAILNNDPESLLTSIQELVMSGRDLAKFVTDLGGYFRNLLIAAVSEDPKRLIQMRGEDIEHLKALAATSNSAALTGIIGGLAELQVSLRFSPDIRTSLEIGLIQLSAKGQVFEVPAQASHVAAPRREAPRKIVSVPIVQADREPQPPLPPVAKTEEIVEEIRESRTQGASPTCLTPDTSLIKTDKGNESLLSVWRDVLENIQKERRLDVALCARPARIFVNDGNFEIRFENNLFGQYACLNKKECIDLIQRLIHERTGILYPVLIALDEKIDREVGETAEEPWMHQARDVAFSEELPPPFDEAGTD